MTALTARSRTVPNVRTLPPMQKTANGLKSNVKSLPAELLPRKQADVLPYLSPARVLSKAEKFATDFLHRKNELERLDAYNENLRVSLNLRETAPPARALDVRVINLEQLKASVAHVGNDGLFPRAPPPPPPYTAGPRPPPGPPSFPGGWPSGGGSGGGGGRRDDLAQINPLTKELKTTSMQTMTETANAATSPKTLMQDASTDARPQTHSMETQADMALDNPLPTIVNHHYHNSQNVNQYLMEQSNQYVQNNVQQDYNLTTNYHQQNVLNTAVTNNVLNNTLHHQNVLQMVDNRQAVQNNLVIEPGQISSSLPTITMPNQALIEAAVNESLMIEDVTDVPLRRNSVRRIMQNAATEATEVARRAPDPIEFTGTRKIANPSAKYNVGQRMDVAVPDRWPRPAYVEPVLRRRPRKGQQMPDPRPTKRRKLSDL